MALVVEPEHDVLTAAEELSDELELLGGANVDRIHGAQGAGDLASRLAESKQPVVISGVDTWPPSEWLHLDQLRSRLARDERTALVVSRAAFEDIMRTSPNFSSWLGGSVWTYQPKGAELTEDERARRLETLRDWSGLSDAEVIARAERGALATDPEFAEWLVLLHRGDLLER